MTLVTVSHVTKHFGGPTLLKDITLAIEPGMKVGVIGRNGCGKSTLLKMIVGMEEPVSGEIHRRRGIRIAWQAQELSFAPGATVMEEMRRVFEADVKRSARLRELEAKLAEGGDETAQQRLLAEYERLQHEHDAKGGWDIDQRIATVLSGLGLPKEAWDQPIERFSGGERNILGIARILLSEPDIMLLDEPSNHLDMEGVEWFIDFVRNTSASVVMVSHNRHLLDATVGEIWEVRSGSLHRYTGNYSDFQRQKAEALALQERQYKSQQRLIKRIEFQARRLLDMARAYDDPGQAKRAKSMLKRIEQMDKVERPDTTDKRFHARFGGRRHGDIALSVKDFTTGFGDRLLFDRASLEIEYGERVCLAGPNGSGKTTLLRKLLEEGSWENQTLRLGKSVRIGAYRQLHEEALSQETRLIDWAMRETGLLYQPATELLHRFLFTRDDLERTIGTLSGGEKSRLQLARLVAAQVNFLILDEPTNHLDIEGCEQLEEMLEEFDGTLLIVSHDRYFLDRLVSRVVEVADRKLVSCEGSFAEWWAAKHANLQRGPLRLHSRKSAAERRGDAKAEYEAQKSTQREKQQIRKRLRSLEQRIEKLEARQAELAAALEDHFAEGRDAAEGRKLQEEFSSVREEVESSMQEWENLAALVDDGP